MKLMIIIIPLLTMCIVKCNSANILTISTFPGHSHYVMIAPLITELAKRGHNVTSITYFPQKKPVENITEIDVSTTHPLITSNIPVAESLHNWRPLFNLLDFVYTFSREHCELVLQEKQVQELLKNEDNKFDLVIAEMFGSDCYLAFAHKYNAAMVSVTASLSFPWVHNLIANDDNPSYVPTFMTHVGVLKTFSDRLSNVYRNFVANIGYEYFSNYLTQKVVEKYFGKLPPLRDIRNGRSLIFANTHHSFRHIQPMVPNYVEVAGIHLTASKPLPKDIQEFLDNSPNGAILVSLGSVIRTSTMSPETLQIFLKVFEKLPYQILWKVEDNLPNLPANVKTRSWIPIQDVLDHPNILLMIMHGGMSTTIEIVNAGVPAVGIPVFADQLGNIDSLVNKGVAVMIDYLDITQQSLYNAVIQVATNPSYRENMKRLSAIFKDRQNPPLETAIYWVEYFVRHNGAKHLQSPAVHLSWYQLMLLDIVLVIIISLLFTVFSLYFILKTLKRLLFTAKTKSKVS